MIPPGTWVLTANCVSNNQWGYVCMSSDNTIAVKYRSLVTLIYTWDNKAGLWSAEYNGFTNYVLVVS